MSTVPDALVAVVTRTRNRPKFLERALKSVHSQTMTDFIHVIINDSGDPKEVENIVAKTTFNKNQIRIIHNKESSGIEAASNKAIKSCNSTYVAVHDDDDTWHPDFLKLTTEHLEKTGSMGVVVTTDNVIERLNADNTVTKIKQERWMPDMKQISLYRQFRENQMTPITFLYNREVFKKLGFYDEALPVFGDWDFGIRFITNYDVDFLDTKQALAYYHHRNYQPGAQGNSVFAGNDLDRKFINYLLNKYLRADLQKGHVGAGYIMNEIRFVNEKYHVLETKYDELQKRYEQLYLQMKNTQETLIYRTSLKGFIKSNKEGAKKRLNGTKAQGSK